MYRYCQASGLNFGYRYVAYARPDQRADSRLQGADFQCIGLENRRKSVGIRHGSRRVEVGKSAMVRIFHRQIVYES